MGSIIFDCEKDCDIKNKEISIRVSKNPSYTKDKSKIEQLINSIYKYYLIQICKRLKELPKKEKPIIQPNISPARISPEPNPSNMDATLNSSMNKRDLEEGSQLDKNLNSNEKIHNQESSNQIGETPIGNIGNIINEPPIEQPSKKEKILKHKPISKTGNKKKPSQQTQFLTPIPEFENLNYDKSMLPGNIIINFNDIPQLDKITEIENNIGGEFFIGEKEILKCMEDYPYVPKFFSIRYPSGEKYSGYFSPNWVKEVFGIQIDKNGSKYVGMFKNGMFEGKGRLILHKGDYYEGEFVQNKANGQGKYVNSKGEIYNGYWINDKQEGEGELILKDGSIYMGEFKNGKKNGKGRINWNDNSYYEGDFVNNYFEGYGVYIMINKRKGYLGEWKEGKMHGFGVFFWADGRSYKGYYEMDKKSGYGIYSGKNNLRYEGKFKKGKQYGLGRIINENGEKQFGLYLKGKRLKYLNENDFKEDIDILDSEIAKINNIFNTNEFFVKNKELMNITLDQT